MDTSSYRRLRPALVAIAIVVFALVATAASADQGKGGSNGQSAKESKGRKHHKHHGKRGPRGPRGPQGPAGPGGPGGPPGIGTPFAFALRTNSQTQPVFNFNSVLIEAGCINGALELVVRPQGTDHNIVEITSIDNSAGGVVRGASYPEAAINQPISMLVGGTGFDDYNGLLAVRTLGGAMTTVQWWAMGSSNASQGDCVGGGTASP